MAARRDRERRRPAAEREYRFARPAAEDALVTDGEREIETTAQAESESRSQKALPRRSRQLAADGAAASARGGAHSVRPFAAYKAEYAYVLGDLRRVALVIGSLLLILLLLYFVLPR